MKQFIKDYGILIIAIYGVAQVWFLALWKRYFRRGRVETFPSGRIEIGHGNFGPTLAINGTLRAINRDLFVSSMQITVRRRKDGAEHILQWTAFRPPVINVLGATNPNVELPSGFIVKPDNPYRYNIFFSDHLVQEEMAPSMTALQQAWGRFLLDRSLVIVGLTKTGQSHQTSIEKLFNEEFSKKKECLDAWDMIQKNVFWESGAYDATLEMTTGDYNRVFRHPFSFSVDSSSYDKFRANAVATIREVCLKEINYYLAFANYAS